MTVSKNAMSAESTLAFAAVVFLGITTQVAFKLSQRNGKYEYNTMSAMTVVECIKLCMSLFQHYNQRGRSVEAVREEFREVPRIVYQSYFYLAFSYAVYNQLVFAVMRVAEPGTFSVIKSFTPAIVSVLNVSMFGERLTKQQWLCVLIQIFGIIPVIARSDSAGDNTASLSYEASSMFLIFFTITMASVNTVYNAKVLKELTLPIAVQNSVLYMFGAAANLAGYACFRLIGDENNGQQSFFHGYDNPGVILLLVLNSFVGIAITMIYKYGGAVLKTLASPFAAAILVYLSYLFFDMPLDIVKAAGAAVVIIDTMLYLSLAPVSKNPENPMSHKNTKSLNFLLLLFSICGLYALSAPELPDFAESSLTFQRTQPTAAEKLPITLIVQALKLEQNTTEEALLINKQKLRIFESYRPYFQDVIIDSPVYAGDEWVRDACNDVAFEGIDAECSRCGYTIPLVAVNKGDDLYRFACTGKLMTTLKAKPGINKGVLVIHADFYLLPSFITMAREYLTNFPGSYWMPVGWQDKHQRKARPRFKPAVVPITDKWKWSRYYPNVEAFRAELSNRDGLEGKVGFPSYKDIDHWADMYFTPVEYWDDFPPLAELMRKHNIMNEIAVPLIHKIIAEMHDFKGMVEMTTWGGCCERARLQDHFNLTEKMAAHPCGHKVDLSSALERSNLIGVWQDASNFMPSIIEKSLIKEVIQTAQKRNGFV